MKTFLIPAIALSFAAGFASCGNDDKEPNDEKNTGTSVEVTVTHSQYANGKLSVILGSPLTIDAGSVQVSINPPQEYTLELVPESNEYFTFTSEGLLTGLKEGNDAGDVGEITIRVLASGGDKTGKTLASKVIPVNVVGMLVSIINHVYYVTDTFRVVAGGEFLLGASNVQITPSKPEYSVKFAPKATRYFTFSEDGVLDAVLDGVGAIEVLVMSGADTLKVQPFYVKVAPSPDWVTSVEGKIGGKKTKYFLISETGEATDVKPYFTVTGGVNKALRFTSSNTGVATVDENTGMVIVNSGLSDYAFIKATATDGSQRADSIRVTTAREFPGHSCDWNLCNILTDGNTKEDSRYVSCNVWDGDVATAWVYRLDQTFTRPRYPTVTFLRGRYGKEWVDGDYNPTGPDFVMGGDPIPKKEATWGVWAANLDGDNTFKKIIVTRGFYTDERGRKIYQSGTMYLEFWDNNANTCVKLGKHAFTSDPNDSEWVIDLTQSFEVWNTAPNTDVSLGQASFPNGIKGTELQMMLSAEGASPASDGKYYWAIADVLLFE
ncbi:MAG: hypothetical protein LBK18_06275 [Prevotellaceae bacterium]|jgi:hypothetical protein|nr:hypothetical protein [Prevotellaceae bacterium]